VETLDDPLCFFHHFLSFIGDIGDCRHLYGRTKMAAHLYHAAGFSDRSRFFRHRDMERAVFQGGEE
jgi:hypothetical protein